MQTNKMSRRTIALCLVLFISIFSANKSLAAKESTQDDKKVPIVYLQEAIKKDLFDTYSYPARVIPQVSADVLSESDGIVQKVLAPLGTKVKRGQKLLSIKHTDPVYQYAKAFVRAPVDGVVSKFLVRKGTHVRRGQELLTVTDPEKVSITVEIAAIDLPVIKNGMAAKFRISGGEKMVPVTVSGVSPFVDSKTGTATCELDIDKSSSSHSVYPGMVGQVLFRANERKGFVVPDVALYYQGKNPLLRLVGKDSIAKHVPIKLGKRQRGEVEVLSGLTMGDKFIQRTSRYVADGQKVTIQTKNENSEEKQKGKKSKTAEKKTKKG